jgi:class 3 adenylate cyclase
MYFGSCRFAKAAKLSAVPESTNSEAAVATADQQIRQNKEQVAATQQSIDELNAQLQRKNLEFQVIQILSTEIATTLDLDRIFKLTMNSLEECFGFKHSLVLLKEPDADVVKVAASHGYVDKGTGATVPFGQGVIGVVAKRRKLMRSVGMQYQMVYARAVGQGMQQKAEQVSLPGLQNVKSQLAIPLIVRDELIGVYAVESEQVNAFDLLDEKILLIVGNQIGSAIQNARAFGQIQEFSASLETKVQERTVELERYARSLNLLNEMSQGYNTATTIDEVFQNTARYMRKIFDSTRASLAIIDSRSEFFTIMGLEGDNAIPVGDAMAVAGTRIEKVVRDLKIWNSPDLTGLAEPDSQLLVARGMVSAINCPLIAGGRVLGTLNMASDKPAAFDDQDEFMLFHISASLAASLELRRETQAVKEKVTELSVLTQNLTVSRAAAEKARELAESERKRSDELLLNILPAPIAEELKTSQQVTPQYFESVSVLFTDFVGFTQISEKLTPAELVQELDGCFSQFDAVVKRNNLEKLKTIGDAYMCAGGLPKVTQNHAIDICLAALEFRSFMLQMQQIKSAMNLPFWQLRIGIHSGPVTAGVIGTNKFAYDIWGDTVNTASRMESSGKPGRINISGATAKLVEHLFECEHRGKVNAKGKGEVDMYFLERLKPEFSADEDGLLPNSLFLKQTSK